MGVYKYIFFLVFSLGYSRELLCPPGISVQQLSKLFNVSMRNVEPLARTVFRSVKQMPIKTSVSQAIATGPVIQPGKTFVGPLQSQVFQKPQNFNNIEGVTKFLAPQQRQPSAPQATVVGATSVSASPKGGISEQAKKILEEHFGKTEIKPETIQGVSLEDQQSKRLHESLTGVRSVMKDLGFTFEEEKEPAQFEGIIASNVFGKYLDTTGNSIDIETFLSAFGQDKFTNVAALHTDKKYETSIKDIFDEIKKLSTLKVATGGSGMFEFFEEANPEVFIGALIGGENLKGDLLKIKNTLGLGVYSEIARQIAYGSMGLALSGPFEQYIGGKIEQTNTIEELDALKKERESIQQEIKGLKEESLQRKFLNAFFDKTLSSALEKIETKEELLKKERLEAKTKRVGTLEALVDKVKGKEGAEEIVRRAEDALAKERESLSQEKEELERLKQKQKQEAAGDLEKIKIDKEALQTQKEALEELSKKLKEKESQFEEGAQGSKQQQKQIEEGLSSAREQLEKGQEELKEQGAQLAERERELTQKRAQQEKLDREEIERRARDKERLDIEEQARVEDERSRLERARREEREKTILEMREKEERSRQRVKIPAALRKKIEKAEEKKQRVRIKREEEIFGVSPDEFIPEAQPEISEVAKSVATIRTLLESLGIKPLESISPGVVDKAWGWLGYDPLESEIEDLLQKSPDYEKAVTRYINFKNIVDIAKLKQALKIERKTQQQLKKLIGGYEVFKDWEDSGDFFSALQTIFPKGAGWDYIKILKEEIFKALGVSLTPEQVEKVQQQPSQKEVVRQTFFREHPRDLGVRKENIVGTLTTLRRILSPILVQRGIMTRGEIEKAVDDFLQNNDPSAIKKMIDFKVATKEDIFALLGVRDIKSTINLKSAFNVVVGKWQSKVKEALVLTDKIGVDSRAYERDIIEKTQTALQNILKEHADGYLKAIDTLKDTVKQEQLYRTSLQQIKDNVDSADDSARKIVTSVYRDVAQKIAEKLADIVRPLIEKVRSILQPLGVLFKRGADTIARGIIDKNAPEKKPSLAGFIAVQELKSTAALGKYNLDGIVAQLQEHKSKSLKDFYDAVIKNLISNYPASALGKVIKNIEAALKNLSRADYLKESDISEFKQAIALEIIKGVVAQNLMYILADVERAQKISDDIDEIQQDNAYQAFARKEDLNDLYNQARGEARRVVEESGIVFAEVPEEALPIKRQKTEETPTVAKKEPVVTKTSEEMFAQKAPDIYRALQRVRSIIGDLGFIFDKDLDSLSKRTTMADPWLEWKSNRGDGELILSSRRPQERFEKQRGILKAPLEIMSIITSWEQPTSFINGFKDGIALRENLTFLEDKGVLEKGKKQKILSALALDSIIAVVRDHAKRYESESIDKEHYVLGIQNFKKASDQLLRFDKIIKDKLGRIYTRSLQKLAREIKRQRTVRDLEREAKTRKLRVTPKMPSIAAVA